MSRRLRILVAVGLMVIGATVVWRHYRYARPVGEGPAGPVVPREAFASKWSDRKVVLLGFPRVAIAPASVRTRRRCP